MGDACSPAALSPVKGRDARRRAFRQWIFPGCWHWRGEAWGGRQVELRAGSC